MMKSVKGLARANHKTQFSSLEKNQLDAVPTSEKALKMYLCPLQLLCPRFIPKRVGTKILPFDFLFRSQVSYTLLMGKAWVVVSDSLGWDCHQVPIAAWLSTNSVLTLELE